MAELIKKKRRGEPHTDEEIRHLVSAYAAGQIPDYQMSAWLMAVCFQGMDLHETAVLTESMKNSGESLNFKHLPVRVDKHSSGGVGDKTSLLIGPIVSACGVHIPMIAGRGLGHTGGTLDKLESIPGFRIHLTHEEFANNVEEHYFSLMGQTMNICPADRKLYALRDVTGTIDSLPLICGSIMSKKLAEDLTGLVLDIKFGSGAFMKTIEQAEALARLLKDTGEHHGVKTTAYLTNMDQPLGRYAGNSLEIEEILEILQNKTCVVNNFDFYSDTRELSLQLSAEMLVLGKKAKTREAGYALATETLVSGRAHQKFLELCEYQGPCDLAELPKARNRVAVSAKRSGHIRRLNTEMLGLATIELGAGRKSSEQKIDPSTGLEFNMKLGHAVKVGEPLLWVHANNEDQLQGALALIEGAIEIGDGKVAEQPLIGKIL